MEPSGYLALLPEIVMVLGGISIMLAVPFAGKNRLVPTSLSPLIAIVTVLTASILLAVHSPRFLEHQWQLLYSNDALSISFRFVFLILILMTLFISFGFLKREGINFGEYYSLLLFTYLGMSMMAAGVDFLITFVGLEILSIGSYALLGFKRSDLRSNESSLKYFILGSFSSALFLYGIVLIYGSCGSTRYEVVAESIKGSSEVSALLLAGLALTIAGFGFKLAVFPFHGWAPDVYEGAPTPVTGFMSVAPKAAALAALLRILYVAFPEVSGTWIEILAWSSILTMTLGNLAALTQMNLKRMLAYSSIAHAGYMLIAFVTRPQDAVAALIFYVLSYGFMNLGAFAVISWMSGEGDHRVNLRDYAGLGIQKPLLSACLTLFLFSLIGIPLTGGFMAKFYLFSAAVHNGWTVLVVLAVLNSAVSAFYYLRVVVYMYMKSSSDLVSVHPIPPLTALAIALSAFGTLWLGIGPTFWLKLAQTSVLALK